MVRSNFTIFHQDSLRLLTHSNAAIGNAAFASVLAEAAIYREWMVNIGRKEARASISHFICELVVRLKRQKLMTGNDLELPLTQEQIGDVLGLSSVRVNRTLRTLSEDGLICRDGRFIYIDDWERLCDIGGFTHRYLNGLGETGNSTPRANSWTP